VIIKLRVEGSCEDSTTDYRIGHVVKRLGDSSRSHLKGTRRNSIRYQNPAVKQWEKC